MMKGLLRLGQEKYLLFKKVWDFFLNFSFPSYCFSCGVQISARDFLCPSCRLKLIPLGNACPICAKPYSSGNHLCGECAKSTRSFTLVLAPFRYEGIITQAICEFKYQKKIWLAKPLALLWKETISERLPVFDYVIPVPLHLRRLKERGFNQSFLLAQKIFGRPRVKTWLLRIRDTKPQVTLSSKDRVKNVRNAFVLKNGIDLSGKRIILFDDVMTTGATVEECSKVLREAMVKEVYVAVLARAS